MEFPHLGKHCSEETCKRLDFLPVKCDACQQIFCSNHMKYIQHNCPNAVNKNIQVPVCPLCNKPVPVTRGVTPDIDVSRHIDNDCKFDRKGKIFVNKCSLEGCKAKEMIPFICGQCKRNFCLNHRHIADHRCTRTYTRDTGVRSALIQGNMSEDEALAKAIQMSLVEERQRTNDTNKQNCDIS